MQFVDTVVKHSVQTQYRDTNNIMYANSREEMERSERNTSSSPKEAIEQLASHAGHNNPTEKHTKGRKAQACFRTVRKAVKHHFQTLKTKVCPHVPDREPSQERPHTSRQEPTPASDLLESEPVFDCAQATQICAVVSAESRSNVFEDALEYLPEKMESNSPTEAPEQLAAGAAQNNPAGEKHKKGRKARVCFRTVQKADFQTLKTKVRPCVPSQEHPHTSRQEPTPGSDPLDSAVVSAESSTDVFEDTFEYLPEKMESSSPTEAPEQLAEKHTKERKACLCFRTVRKAVKRHFQTLKTKGSPCVPDQEPSQERPHTSRQEPTPDSDPLESEPIFDYPQATHSNAVVSAESSSDVFKDTFEYLPEKMESSSPTEVPEQLAEEHTKARTCFWTVRKAVKSHFQTLKTKGSPHVPDREPSQERPHTSRQDPTSGSDPLESDPKDKKHTEGRKDSGHFQTVWKTVKRHLQKDKACPLVIDQFPVHTPTFRLSLRRSTVSHEFEPKFNYPLVLLSSESSESSSDVFEDTLEYFPSELIDPLEVEPSNDKYIRFSRLRRELVSRYIHFPYEVRLQHGAEYFRSLYEVGREVGPRRYASTIHEGIRRSDGQKVTIKFVSKSRSELTLTPPLEFFKPLCEEATVMLELQRPPSCDYVLKLYDWFIMEEQDVLVMEYLNHYMRLSDFIRQNRGHLTEQVAKRIMWQLTVVLRHCLDRNIHYPKMVWSSILINTDTLQLKLADFNLVLYIPSEREMFLHEIFEGLYCLLKVLIKGIPLWKRAFLSIECRTLLWKLQHRRISLTGNLQDILDHAWFENCFTKNEGDRNG